jgi:glycosyltransferase involved in cell wall biosynthesis
LIRHIAVIVPAANEEKHIDKCLSSIRSARAHLYRASASIRIRIVVVLDGCRDLTAHIAATYGDVQSVTISAGNVGMARRAGAHAALAGGGPVSELWLANTDADSEVPANWLASMMAEARLGAHLVLGTVVPGPGLRPRARTQWLKRHRLHDGHPHVHGANFGIRGDAYLALGGWQPLVTGEDADLARRAAGTGHLRISRIASAPVMTSARQQGRAPRGFSRYLRDQGTPDACIRLTRPRSVNESPGCFPGGMP